MTLGGLFKAAKYNESLAIFVPLRLIPPGEPSDVLEMTIAEDGGSGADHVLYARRPPGFRRAYLDLCQIRTRRGAPFAIRSVVSYDLKKFVEDYNQCRPEGMENTSLVWDAQQILMRVGEGAISLAPKQMRAHKGMAFLHAQLDDGWRLKVRKSIGGFGLTLLGAGPVTAVRLVGNTLVVKYSSPRKTRHESVHCMLTGSTTKHHRIAARLEGGVFALRDSRQFLGDYRLVLSESVHAKAMAVLHSSASLEEYKNWKGAVAEAILDAALTSVGCVELANHPFCRNVERIGQETKGPDSLRWLEDAGSVCFEFKWWSDSRKAKYDALAQIRHYRTLFGRTQSGPRDWFAAVLDWDGCSSEARMTIMNAPER